MTLYHGGEPLSLQTEEYLSGDRVTLMLGSLVVRAAPEEIGKYILYWYTAETERITRELLPAWSKKLRVRPRAVAVNYAKTRWGSCSSKGRIFLNSRLAMLTPDVAEYVIVHELCHLKQMNHSKKFWGEVTSALPDAQARRRSLREQEKKAALP